MSWGLVLSGGAAYGLANIGVLKALEEAGHIPNYIAGSSMGSIVGGLYALTQDVKLLEETANNISMLSSVSLSETPLKDGMHGGLLRANLEKYLEPVLGDATIGDCTISFVCVAGRVQKPIEWMKIIQSGFVDDIYASIEPHIFPNETKLIDAMLCSSAIPVLFSPVENEQGAFIDLVDFGAIPSRSLKKTYNPDVIVATDTVPRYPLLQKILPRGWKEFLEEGHKELKRSKDCADILIEPKLSGGALRFDKATVFIEEGYNATMQKMHTITSTV